MLFHAPVVAVLGCTGTGKSKLAIELAKKFNGEIISADSMQVYKGLDIVTNKVTLEEQEAAVHHFINFVDPLSRYTVVDFRNQALPVIENIMKQNKLPIIVGGTNYYIESLFWEVLISAQSKKDDLLFDSDSDSDSNIVTTLNGVSSTTKDLFKQKIVPDSFEDIPSSVLHKCLQEIDADMANSLHPEDRRKVIRSLQVFQQHKRGPLRFKNAVMLWLQCDKEVLGPRLDDRVDEMIERGLIEELLDFHKNYNKSRIDIEVLKCIIGVGFDKSSSLCDTSSPFTNIRNKNLYSSLKFAQYIRLKLGVGKLFRPDRQLPPVYGLAATDLEKWEENVLMPAIDIVQSITEGKKPSQNPLPVEERVNDIKETYYCDICEKVILGQNTWQIHLKSKRHYKVKASKLKKSSREVNTEKCVSAS
ncbi:tRNA dimethylallyltransferase [Trichonephila inaurata madagascariensis]|uniref:tRNA dimethylallyltransferase n=1 Tax=Trichonephila inaurata madagascariensis TaxID=2747483 RepID=A0A8X7CSK7_9ARAC|nr:tRNA dimethylallyltransferase [Trichonephila inaurata madagascariensis]